MDLRFTIWCRTVPLSIGHAHGRVLDADEHLIGARTSVRMCDFILLPNTPVHYRVTVTVRSIVRT
jgi:hypothetical protein